MILITANLTVNIENINAELKSKFSTVNKQSEDVLYDIDFDSQRKSCLESGLRGIF